MNGSDFEQFWSRYPRREARKDALKAWNQMTPDQQFAALESISLHARFWELSGREKRYIPLAATWLRGERWSDELEMPVPKTESDWFTTKQGIEKKAREVGCWPARANEGWHELKARVFARLKDAA